MRLECPRCHTFVVGTPGSRVACPQCGNMATVPLSSMAPAPPPSQPGMARPLGAPIRIPAQAPRPVPVVDERGRALTGLLINLVLPGAGTLNEGRRGEGWLQLLAFLLGLATIMFLVGLAVAAASWMWAVVSSIVRMARPATEPLFDPA